MADSNTGQTIRRMIWTALFLAFLIFIAIPTPIPYDDVPAWLGVILNFLGFLKAFLIGKPRSYNEIKAARTIPGYNLPKQLR